jgi:hypothetical protein
MTARFSTGHSAPKRPKLARVTTGKLQCVVAPMRAMRTTKTAEML